MNEHEPALTGFTREQELREVRYEKGEGMNTQGPWLVEHYTNGNVLVLGAVKSDHSAFVVCEVPPGHAQEPDAKLIAAALKLLEACKRFVKAQDADDRDGMTSAAMLASRAINLAEKGAT